MSSQRRRHRSRKRPFFNRQEQRTWLVLGATAMALAAFGFVAWRRSARAVPKITPPVVAEPEPSASGPALIPRGGLEMQTVVERTEGSRRILLKVGGGEALLTLGPLEPGATSDGRGTLVAENSEKGAAFLTAFSAWINEPAPPRRATSTPLKALDVRYRRLAVATSRAPEALRLTLIGSRRQGEIYINLFPDGARAAFLERGRPETRAALVMLLAEGLRDGPKPPRTHATDPNLSSDTPLSSAVRPLLPTPVIATACGEHELYAAVKDGWRTKVVAVSDPSAPPRTITTFDGVLERMSGAPDGKHLALLIVHAASPDQIQPEDARELRLIDAMGGAPLVLSAADEGFRGTSLPIWSKQLLVVEGRLQTTSPGDRIVRAYGFPTPSLLGDTKAQLRLHPARFEGDQVVLVGWDSAPIPRRRLYGWTPGSEPVPKESIPFTSPDGRFVFSIADDKIVAKDGKTFTSVDPDDKAAIRALDTGAPIWVGKHVLGLQSDVPLALDLETMHSRPVANQANATLVCTTTDGKRALLLTPDGSATVADLGGQVPQ